MTLFDPSDDLSYVHLLITSEITIELPMSMFVPWCTLFGYLINEPGHCSSVASSLGSRGDLWLVPSSLTITFVIRLVLFFILVVDLGFDIKETIGLVPPTSLSKSARVLHPGTKCRGGAWKYADLLPTFYESSADNLRNTCHDG